MIEYIRKKPHTGPELIENRTVPYFSYPALSEIPWLVHGFSTRLGGVSTGPRAFLNLQFKGDEAEAVRENYRRFGEAVGFPWERSVFSAQTHTVHVLKVAEEDAGRGAVREKGYAGVDGLITDTPELPILCFSADCALIFLVDRKHRAIGLAHSGWRGTQNRMAGRALAAMKEAFGTVPEDVTAAVGPCICRECFEVGPEVIEAFSQTFSPEKMRLLVRPGKGDRSFFDLSLANRLILEEEGVPAGQITLPDVCTRCNPELLFSHRKTGPERGTLAAVMMISQNGRR